MHKSATKCNEKIGKWCKNKHGASKIIDTLETYQPFITDNAVCKLCLEILFGHHVLSVKLVVEQEPGKKLMY
jgi:hypothetical protein